MGCLFEVLFESNIAKRFKLSIVMSVHQPSNEMYDLLDDVMFIDSGKMAYHGPAKNALVLIPDGILSDDYPAGRCPADVLLQNGKRIFNFKIYFFKILYR